MGMTDGHCWLVSMALATAVKQQIPLRDDERKHFSQVLETVFDALQEELSK
jgi:hypothetical protein